MNNQYLRFAEKQFTGLTGTGSVNWDPFDFSSAPFPSTATFSVLRCMIDISCVAIAVSTETGAVYHTDFAATAVYTWKVSGFVGTLVDIDTSIKNGVVPPGAGAFTPGSSELSWSVTNGGGAGAMRITATATSTLNTFNISMTARIVSYVDY